MLKVQCNYMYFPNYLQTLTCIELHVGFEEFLVVRTPNVEESFAPMLLLYRNYNNTCIHCVQKKGPTIS